MIIPTATEAQPTLGSNFELTDIKREMTVDEFEKITAEQVMMLPQFLWSLT